MKYERAPRRLQAVQRFTEDGNEVYDISLKTDNSDEFTLSAHLYQRLSNNPMYCTINFESEDKNKYQTPFCVYRDKYVEDFFNWLIRNWHHQIRVGEGIEVQTVKGLYFSINLRKERLVDLLISGQRRLKDGDTDSVFITITKLPHYDDCSTKEK